MDNDLRFTRAVFTRIARDITTTLNISGVNIDLLSAVDIYNKNNQAHQQKEKLRTKFKDFYKDPAIQGLLKSRDPKLNIWKLWVAANQGECNKFKISFIKKVKSTLEKGFGVDRTKLEFIQDF